MYQPIFDEIGRNGGKMSNVIRIFVEKKSGFDVEAQQIKADLKGNLGMGSIEDLRLLHRYDVAGLSPEEFQDRKSTRLNSSHRLIYL